MLGACLVWLAALRVLTFTVTDRHLAARSIVGRSG
jgi:hypothetical protein